MKKLKVLMGALALFAAMAFVGCSNGNNDSNGGGDKTNPGEITNEEGVLVFDISASYDNFIDFESAIPENSGYTKAHVIGKYESATGGKACLQLMDMDESHADQASATLELDKTYSEKSVNCFAGATYDKWVVDHSEATACVDTANRVQGFIQETQNWGTVTGKIYIKKAWLSGEGKEDLVIFDYTAE